MTAFDTLLDQARRTHATEPILNGFSPFPDDLSDQAFDPRALPCAATMAAMARVEAGHLGPFRDAFIAAGPEAFWRATYEDTDIGADFMDRFACYALIGPDAPWTSAKMLAFIVAMPPHLHYPWHHHPAEELYFVLAGQADFHRHGEASETLGPGQGSYHASMQPHAMTTRDHPVLAYVLWRGDLQTPPVWTEDGP